MKNEKRWKLSVGTLALVLLLLTVPMWRPSWRSGSPIATAVLIGMVLLAFGLIAWRIRGRTWLDVSALIVFVPIGVLVVLLMFVYAMGGSNLQDLAVSAGVPLAALTIGLWAQRFRRRRLQ